ncbi:Phage protein [Yersinia phage fHe-Yen9-04]|uniref:Phage protein n=1 Tax=Yersinia phage fHe-Yen9-04 TaxID=2052742 RepID=A0A2C9CXU4_9CAUD|nr:Phage protein [Yersinia phage fHe-Yen9-04]SOK58651.1 Phage protein [Yersinia phage fHe-Yen9-04]VUE36420.1 Phage protein [Yersinia phage fHe-Yen9-04]
MGSFHTTCAVSNTPIREGDKVRLFFLVSHQFSYRYDPLRHSISNGCQCYPHDDFTVIGGISLEAEYSDYNTYSFDQESIYARYIRYIIKRDYAMNVSEEGKEYNEYHDHMDISKDDLSWGKIQDMIHSGRLFINSYGSNLPFVATMAIHESVYQIMLNEPFERYVGYPDGMNYSSDFNPYETVDFKNLLEVELTKDNSIEVNKRIAEMMELLKDKFETEPEKEAETLEMVKRMVKRELGSRRDNGYEYAYSALSPLEELRELAEKNESADEDHRVVLTPFTDSDLVAKTFEGRFFDGRMYTHNIMYRPIMTSGQEHDLTSDGIFWMKVGAALMTLNDQWESEEHFSTKKYSEQWQEMTYDTLVIGIKDWYEETDVEYIDFMTSLEELLKDKTEVEIKVDEFKNPEYQFISMYIWNKMLPLRILKN